MPPAQNYSLGVIFIDSGKVIIIIIKPKISISLDILKGRQVINFLLLYARHTHNTEQVKSNRFKHTTYTREEHFGFW